ncbi:MAG: PAS domain-containing protein, partial [Gammaproteobacteria bacterium]|nr:PAS domain-containing protein [Gammaproteobacteria bacterium]
SRAGRASQAKNAFLANVSHELRTPLNAILGFSDILKEELFGPLGVRYRGYAGDINASASHLLGLVDDLLDLSKIEAGATELEEQTVALPDLLDDVARMLAPDADRAGVTIEAQAQASLPAVSADRRQLRQVLINLVGNAIKYSPPGEVVRLSALLLADGGMAMVVTDTGIGIAVADQERAMTPYGRIGGRLDSRGAGLGLPIAKAMIERHGGRMFLNSDLGAGTSVFVTLPADRVVGHSLPGEAFADPVTLSDPVAGLKVRSFAGHDLDEIEALAPDNLDRLPVGVIRLDREGRVLSYNAVESHYSGLKPATVIGRDFFREIAPCTAGSVFERTFREGMAAGKLDALLEYVFAFPGRPMRVAVQMRSGRDPDTAWIFVRWV